MTFEETIKGKHILILEGYARQCLPYMREFKKMGCEISLLCHTRLDCGYASRLPDHKILGICDPDRYEDSERFIVDLIKTGKYDLVFTLVDFSAGILARHKEELSAYAIICTNDCDVYERSQDKLEVMRVCAENGIPHPMTIENVSTVADVLASGIQLPFIIKPRRGCGARGFHKFETAEDFQRYVEDNHIELDQMVVQECLPIESLVMSDNIYIDRNGEIKSSFLYGSYRIYPIKGGTGTFNITFDRPEIHRVCAELVQKMQLRGVVGIDLMIDPRDNVAKVIEINPRTLACSKIGFISGVNQARQVLEDAFGFPVTPYMSYKTDMRVRMSQTDTLWFIKSPDRFRTHPSWFSHKNTKDQTFSWDDPLPWFAFLFRGLRNLKKEEDKRK